MNKTLWTATVTDSGKLWNTAWGYKSRAIATRTFDKAEIVLWGPVDDPKIMSLKTGQDIQIYRTEKGEWKISEALPSP